LPVAWPDSMSLWAWVAYATWCRSGNVKQLPAEALASALDELFGVEKDGKDYVVLGVSLKAIEDQSGKPIGALH